MRAFLTCAVALAAACSPEVTSGGGADATAGDAATGGDGSGGHVTGLLRYVGHLNMTATVPFGGAPYCNYSATMKNVVIDLSIDPTKALTWMVVDNLMVEATVGSCPYPPSPPRQQGFEYASSPQPAQPNGAYAPTLMALASNQPTTTIAVTVTPETTTSYASTIRWHRTDQSGNLNWTVNTPGPMDVNLVMCDVGAQYCLGGSQQGAMYTCVDGMHHVMVKPCTAGCAAAPVPPAPRGNEHCN